MTVPRTLLVALPLLTACLSIDVIPQEKDDPAKPDVSTPFPDRDADIAPDVPAACTDRGTYSLAGVEYRGLAQACEGNLVCVDGVCVEPPACVEGEPLTRCAFTPAGIKGVITGFVVADDYVYWLERGTLDARANSNQDGTVARAKFGEWSREVLLDGLDFYDLEGRRWDPPLFSLQGQTLMWTRWKASTDYLRRFTSDRIHGQLAGHGWAFSEDTAYACDGNSIRSYPLDGSALTTRKSAEIVTNTGTLGSCWLERSVGGHLYGFSDAGGLRFAPEPPYLIEQLKYPPHAATSTHFLRRLADSWLAVAPRDESATTWDWKAVAGPGTMLSVDDTYIYWARSEFNGLESLRQFAARTRLDGSGEQEVFIEFGVAANTNPVFAGSRTGVIWHLQANAKFTTLQFAPFPERTTAPDAGVEPDAAAD